MLKNSNINAININHTILVYGYNYYHNIKEKKTKTKMIKTVMNIRFKEKI